MDEEEVVKVKKPRRDTKTPGRLTCVALNEVNQILKKHDTYNFSVEEKCFYGKDTGVQFILQIDECSYFTNNFCVPNAKDLFAFLKDNYEISLDGTTVVGENGNELQLDKVSLEFNKQNYTLLKYIELTSFDFQLTSDDATLAYQDTVVNNFTVNDILALSKENREETGHNFLFLECVSPKKLVLHKSKTDINYKNPFVIIDSKMFHAIKMKSKDVGYFSISFYNNFSGCMVGFGKENFNVLLGFTGIFKF